MLEFKGTKTDEPRVARIPEETLAKLESHRKQQDEFRAQFGEDYRSDLDLIFANPDGSPLKPDSSSATVSLLFKRLKITKPKGSSRHLQRHTMAAQMLDSGVPLPVVSQRLGHSSHIRSTARTTRRYGSGRSTSSGTGRSSRKTGRGTCNEPSCVVARAITCHQIVCKL